MKFLHKYGTRSNEIQRAKRELLTRITLVVAVLVFFIIMVLIGRLKPRLDQEQASGLPDTANVGDPLENPQLNRLRGQVDELLQEFIGRKQGQPVVPEDLKVLEKAIDTQRLVMRSRGSEIAPKADVDRLEELLTRYDEEMGAFLAAQSLRKEEEAVAAWEAKDTAAAVALLLQARDVQQQLNDQYPRSVDRNPTRLHRLNNMVLQWQTQPIAQAADQLRDEAHALAGERQYEEARQRIREALLRQELLNREYRSSRFASIARLKLFQDSAREIELARDNDRVRDLIAEAAQALADGRPEDVMARAEEAAMLQRKVMAQSPERQAGLQETMERIEQLRDTGASLPVHLRIQELEGATRAALRARDMNTFKERVSDWLRETQTLVRTYPRSAYAAGTDTAEVAFLHARREEIPMILEMVDRSLLPVPGRPGLLLLATEVPQALYGSVTGGNPSNSVNPQNPVESVTWQEAREFTRQLGWILSAKVELPSREVFLAALGDEDPRLLATQAWSAENSGREVRPAASGTPNALGFHDLLGNVAEWISAPESDPARVTAIGGACRDSRIRLSGVPEEPREPVERNRFVGFRFTVEYGD